jgi:hypothetical protein
MRHRPFKDLQGLSHNDAISFPQRTPVTWLRCYRDTRLRDDTLSQQNSINNQPELRPSKWQRACNEVNEAKSTEHEKLK